MYASAVRKQFALVSRKNLSRSQQVNVFSPQMVVAGVGVDHQTLVDQTRRLFVTDKTPTWLNEGETWGHAELNNKCVSQYTGGSLLVGFFLKVHQSYMQV